MDFFKEEFNLKKLFIPSDGYFNNKIDDIKSVIDSKFPIITQLTSYLELMLLYEESESLPAFEFEWYGAKLSLMDFTLLKDYLTEIKSLISVFIILQFIVSLYYKLPSLIQGATSFEQQAYQYDTRNAKIIKSYERRGKK